MSYVTKIETPPCQHIANAALQEAWLRRDAPDQRHEPNAAELGLFNRLDATVNTLITSNRQRGLVSGAGLQKLKELRYEMGDVFLLSENTSAHDALQTHGKIAQLIFSAINAASFDAMCAHCAGNKRSAKKAKDQFDEVNGAALPDMLNTWLSIKRLRSEDKTNVIH